MTPPPRPRFWLAVMLALQAAALLPIWIGHYLPLLDLPNHLSAITVWHYYDDPRYDFSRYYQLNLSPLPYWGHYYSCHLLGYVFSIETANKIYMSAYAIALPWGVARLCARFGRSPWLALFAFPVVWNHNVAEGFLAFSGGLALLPWGVLVADRHFTRPRLTSGLGLFVFGMLMYSFHLLPYALFLLAIGLMIFVQQRPLSPWLLVTRGLPVLAVAAVGLWAYRHQGEMGFLKLEGKRDLVIDPTGYTLELIPWRFLETLSSSLDEWLVVIMVVCWLLLALSRAEARDDEPPAPRGARWYSPELCLAATLLLFLLLPRSMMRPFYWHMINQRYVPMLFIFAVLTLRGPITGWRRWLLAPVALMTLAYTGGIARAVVRYNQRMADFDAVVDQIPLHKSTLVLSLRPLGDPEVNVNVYNQLPSYVQMRRGGYNHYNFAQGFPLKYRTYKPAPAWDHAEQFVFSYHGQDWDYFLTHNEATSAATPPPRGEPPASADLFSALIAHGKVRLVTARGPFRLYEKLTD